MEVHVWDRRNKKHIVVEGVIHVYNIDTVDEIVLTRENRLGDVRFKRKDYHIDFVQ